MSLVRPLADSASWSNEQVQACEVGGGNGPFNLFMGRYNLDEPTTAFLAKYNSVGCQYWRDKLHQMQNGLMPSQEMPTRARGVLQMDRDVEDGWLLLDCDAVGQLEELDEDDEAYIDLSTSQRGAAAHGKTKKPKGIFGFGLADKMQKMFNAKMVI